jgi:hypothetical protein
VATSESWDDPHRCPFCGATFTSTDAGFVDHVETTLECDAAVGT